MTEEQNKLAEEIERRLGDTPEDWYWSIPLYPKQYRAIIAALRREPSGDYVWLIEHQDQREGLHYWTALTGDTSGWSADPFDAIRFSRRTDAENVAIRLFSFQDPKMWNVAEHCFEGRS